MKKLYKYLRDFIVEDFHPITYGFFFLLMAVLLYVNYSLNFERVYMDGLREQWYQLPLYILYYSVPWILTLLVWSVFSKSEFGLRGEKSFYKRPGFWATAIFAFGLLALNTWFYHYKYWVMEADWIDQATRRYGIQLTWNMKRYFFYFLLLFIFMKLFDREQKSFYGLTVKKFDARPYFLMLGIMLPLVLAASFTSGFQASYPQYVGCSERCWDMPPAFKTGLFELFYGLDFASVELFFRGFLVIGMVKWLGRGAILPMAATYCVLHFGKPAGEAISSIFGGYILGVFAYRSGSIFGGIIVHMGLAWMMEFFAWLTPELFPDTLLF